MKDIEEPQASTILIFLKEASENEALSLEAHGDIIALLERLNGLFNGLTSHPVAGPALPPLLLLQSHASFLAAVRMALSGHTHMAFLALRGSIESGLYGLIMKADEGTQMIWVNRAAERDLCRRTFTATKGLTLLRKLDPRLADLICEIYENTIDRGAHPNIMGISDQLILDEYEENNTIAHIYLHPYDAEPVERTLDICVEAGAPLGWLCKYIMPDHPPAIHAHSEAYEVMKSYLNPGL